MKMRSGHTGCRCPAGHNNSFVIEKRECHLASRAFTHVWQMTCILSSMRVRLGGCLLSLTSSQQTFLSARHSAGKIIIHNLLIYDWCHTFLIECPSEEAVLIFFFFHNYSHVLGVGLGLGLAQVFHELAGQPWRSTKVGAGIGNLFMVLAIAHRSTLREGHRGIFAVHQLILADGISV